MARESKVKLPMKFSSSTIKIRAAGGRSTADNLAEKVVASVQC